MADVFTKSKRSDVMSRIRSRGNKETEVALARLLRAHGITGWRRHVQIVLKAKVAVTAVSKRPPPEGGTPNGTGLRSFRVRPDFVFKKARLAVFVDGCFWHGCPRHATRPKNNRVFWERKLSGNRQRDRLVNRMLRRAGWRVVRIWECALAKRPQAGIERIRRALE